MKILTIIITLLGLNFSLWAATTTSKAPVDLNALFGADENSPHLLAAKDAKSAAECCGANQHPSFLNSTSNASLLISDDDQSNGTK